jgi:hypothetical protein
MCSRRWPANGGLAFLLERAVFVTVLHRLDAPGSDRAAEKWKQSYAIAQAESLEVAPRAVTQ